VGHWITLNEPWCQAYLGENKFFYLIKKNGFIISIYNSGYGTGSKAPGIQRSGTQDYIAGHNQLRAHAKAYRLYENTYKAIQGGMLNLFYFLTDLYYDTLLVLSS